VRRALASIACCGALLAGAAFGQTMYKWVDEKGVTHFTQDPPPAGAKGGKIEVKPTPPSTQHTADDAATWKERARVLEDQRHEREKGEKSAEREKSLRDERCRRARMALDQLNTRRLYTVDAKGERHFMEDSERAAETERVSKAIAENCR
jgi:hypothetical protein